MNIALVHDQLVEFGGAERVFFALKRMYPEAHVFTSLYDPDRLGIHGKETAEWNVRTSWFQQLPASDRLISPLRFLTPLIWESFDFTGYDLVISSSGGHMCKGIITRPETKHICYLHHQPRYLYYYETAIEWQKFWPVRIYGHLINHPLRIWDYLSSQRVDTFIANSEETKHRIKKFYRRDATVVYPPIAIPKKPHEIQKPTEKRYVVTLSRLARAKHIEILIDAAKKSGILLKIIGSGKDEHYLKQYAGRHCEFLGHLPDSEAGEIIDKAYAFLFASVDEEFGMAPVEAMARGVPVIAYKSGGLKETVIPGKTGFLYEPLDPNACSEQIQNLLTMDISEYKTMRMEAKKQAERYSEEQFIRNIQKAVNEICQ